MKLLAETPLTRVEEKWGPAAIAGFQAVPDVLLKYQLGLGLSVTDMVVLLNVLMHWWYVEQKPFPRPTTIAKRMGVNVRTVQRSLYRMEELGLIHRVKGEKGATFVDPEPLVARLSEYALKDKDFQIRSDNRIHKSLPLSDNEAGAPL